MWVSKLHFDTNYYWFVLLQTTFCVWIHRFFILIFSKSLVGLFWASPPFQEPPKKGPLGVRPLQAPQSQSHPQQAPPPQQRVAPQDATATPQEQPQLFILHFRLARGGQSAYVATMNRHRATRAAFCKTWTGDAPWFVHAHPHLLLREQNSHAPAPNPRGAVESVFFAVWRGAWLHGQGPVGWGYGMALHELLLTYFGAVLFNVVSINTRCWLPAGEFVRIPRPFHQDLLFTVARRLLYHAVDIIIPVGNIVRIIIRWHLYCLFVSSVLDDWSLTHSDRSKARTGPCWSRLQLPDKKTNTTRFGMTGQKGTGRWNVGGKNLWLK